MLLAITALLLLADSKPALLHSAPAQAKPNEALQIDGSLQSGGLTFTELVLLYRGPGQDYVEVKMSLQYGDLYRAVIPAAKMVPPGVEYYVEGRTKAADRIPLFMTARKPARVIVLSPDVQEPEEPPPPAEPPKKKKSERFPKAEKFEKEAAADTAPAEPESEPQKIGAAEAPEPQRPAPRRRTRELDEELAVYGAEYPPGFAVKLDPSVRKTPQAWSVVTFAQMKAMGARHVYDVLDRLAGISVSRDVQGFFRLAVRGVRDEASVLYLYDGQPLNTFYDGKAIAWLPIDNLERIEVLRGPGDASTPAGNFTAIVNLVPNRQDGVRAGVQGGLYSTYNPPQASLTAATAPGAKLEDRGLLQGHLAAAKAFAFGLKLALDADVLRDNGYYKPIAQDGLKLATPAGYTVDKRTLINVGALVSYASKSLGTITVHGRVMSEQRTPLVGQFDVTADPGSLSWLTVLVGGTFHKQMTDEVAFTVDAWLSQHSTDRLFHQTPKSFPTSMFEEEGIVENVRFGERTLGLQAKVDFKLPLKNVLTGGVRAEYAQLFDWAYLTNFAGHVSRQTPADVEGPIVAATGIASRRLSIGIFLMDEWRPIERVTVQAGARLELAQLPTGNAQGMADGSSIALGVSPRVGVAFAPLENLVFKAGYARGFRAPTVEETALDIPVTSNNQGRIIGNPSLTPAYLDEVEGSVEYLYGLGDARARARAGGFYDRYSNPIAAVDVTGNLYPYKNRPDGMQGWGVELEGRLEIGARGAAFVNFSWVRVEDLGTVATARFITEAPQLRVNGGVSVPLGPFLTADAFASVHGERRSNARSVLELLRRYRLPAYSVVGLQVRTEALFDHVELSFTVHNLFDVDYADDAPRPDRVTGGVPREGLSGMLGARVFL